MTTRTYIGKLWLLLEERVEPEKYCNETYQLHLQNGEIIEPIHGCDCVPQRVLIEVTLDENNHIIEWSRVPEEGVLAADPLEDKTTPLKIALVRFVKTNQPLTTSLQNLVDRRAEQIRDFFFDLYGGRRKVEAVGILRSSDCDPRAVNPLNSCGTDAWLRDEGHGDDFSHIVMWGGIFPGICGHAYLGGRLAWVYFTSPNCQEGTMVHELGHCLGEHHSGTPGNEYGDQECVLGRSSNMRGMNACKHIKLGLIGEEHITRIEDPQSKRVFLAPIEWDDGALNPGEKKSILIRKQHEGQRNLYVVSTRDAPRVHGVQSHREKHVFVHRTENSLIVAGRSTQIGWLDVNDAITLDDGITIKHDGYKDGVCNIAVKYSENLPSPPPQQFPATKEPHSAYPLSQEHTGYWRNAFHSNQGFEVHVILNQDEPRIVIYWYTFDTRGNPYWYMASGLIKDNAAVLKIYQSEGGFFDDPLAADLKEVGTGTFTTQDSDQGFFVYNLEEFGRGSIRIKKFNTRAVNDFGLGGFWKEIGKENAGWTFLMNIDEDGNLLPVMYHYHQEAAGANPINTKRQRWAQWSGVEIEVYSSRIEFDIFEPRDSTFLHPQPGSLKKIGQAVFEVNHNRILVEYDNGDKHTFNVEHFARS